MKSRLLNFLPKSGFFKSVGILVGGTAIAQGMGILAAPVLTRLYTPDDFGVFAVYTGICGIISVLATLRYELAIPLQKHDRNAAGLVILCLIVACCITFATAVSIIFFSEAITHLLKAPKLNGLLWILPFGVFLTGAFTTFNYWSIRKKEFACISQSKILRSSAALGTQIVAYQAHFAALVWGFTAGQVVETSRLGRIVLKGGDFKNISWRDIRRLAVRYRRFPMISIWTGLAGAIGWQLPALMFAAFFGIGAAGIYALANRVLSLPMSLIGGAVGQVFFSNAAEAYREGKLASLVANAHTKLAQIAMPVTMVLAILGPEIFSFVFGSEWVMAGEFAQWMAPWLYLSFVCSPLGTVFSVIEKQGAFLLFQIVLLIFRVGAIAIGAYWNDLMLTVIFFAGANAICWLGFLFWLGFYSGNSPNNMLQLTTKALLLALMCALPLIIGKLLYSINEMLLIFGIGISFILFTAYYWLLLRKALEES